MTDQAPERQTALLLGGNGEVGVAINAQLETANLVASERGSSGGHARFTTNDDFWLAVFRERLRSGSVVTLENFAISEWFPRSPGLFHTARGMTSRDMAQDYLYPVDRDEVRALREVDPSLSVFNLAGKSAMLDGGFGCIRLRDRLTDQGRLWFMSASATGVAHEGIPIGLRDDIRARLIDDIVSQGAVFGDLAGRLLFVPTILDPLYADYTDVPQLYLLVEDFRPSLRAPTLPTLASAAVSFRRRERGYEEYWIYAAAYVPFHPGADGDLERRLGWLEAYVDRHGGTVITDFDEHRSRFRNAPFSLHKVANGEIDKAEVMDALAGDDYWRRDRFGGPSLTVNVDKLILDQSRLSIKRAEIREIVMGDSFSNIGAGAIIINRSIVQDALNRFADSDTETAEALRTITDHVEKSGNPDAAENLEGFMEEVAREQPRKARLKTFWDGLVTVLPSVAQLGASTQKALELFMQ